MPADRGGQPSTACKFVLVGLANHAGPDGTGAFPSVATLVRYTGLSERTVRTCLDRLEAESIIMPCDPDIVAARIKRADRLPQGWDLNLGPVRDDLDDADVAVLEHQFPGIAARLADARLGDDDQSDGVRSPHPEPGRSEVVDNSRRGAADAPRVREGVQPAQRRGATGAATGCSGCTRTARRTIQGTIRRRAEGSARSDRRGWRRVGRRILRPSAWTGGWPTPSKPG
jgi:Helix-turn-helix domain